MTLVLRPIQAVLTRDTNYFTTMDPYCFFYLGDQVKRTSPHFGGGTKPIWGQVLKFKLGVATKMGVEVWAKSIIGGDSLVGHGMIDLTKMRLGSRPAMQEPIEIFFQNQPAGKVIVEMQIVQPSEIAQPSQIAGNSQIQTGLYQQQQNNWQSSNIAETSKVMGGNDFGRGSNVSPFQGMSMIQNPNDQLSGALVNGTQNSNGAAYFNGYNQIIQNPEQFPLANNELMKSNSVNQFNQQNMNNYINHRLYNSMVGSFSGSQVSQPQPVPAQPEQPMEQTGVFPEPYQFYNINNLGGIGNIVKDNVRNSQPRFRRNSLKDNFRESLRGSNARGKTPVKSILNNKSLGKQNTRGKSPGHKRVQFADQI